MALRPLNSAGPFIPAVTRRIRAQFTHYRTSALKFLRFSAASQPSGLCNRRLAAAITVSYPRCIDVPRIWNIRVAWSTIWNAVQVGWCMGAIISSASSSGVITRLLRALDNIHWSVIKQVTFLLIFCRMNSFEWQQSWRMTGDDRVSVIASLLWCSCSEYSVHAFSHSTYAHLYFQTFQKCVTKFAVYSWRTLRMEWFSIAS